MKEELLQKFDRFLMSRNGSFPSDATVLRQEAVDFAAEIQSDLSTVTAERDRLDEQVNRLSLEISRLNGELSERDLMQYRLEQYHTVLRNLGATFDKDELVLTMPFFCDNCKTLLTEVETTTAERDRLREALADAIRSPMGVEPNSASGLLTQADIEAAEERRVKLRKFEGVPDLGARDKLTVALRDRVTALTVERDDALRNAEVGHELRNRHAHRVVELEAVLFRCKEAVAHLHGCSGSPDGCYACHKAAATALADIDRALYRGEEEKG